MPASLAAAKAALLTTFFPAGVPAVSGVLVVFDFEPTRAELSAGVSMTISSAGITPTDYRTAVRIYVKVSGSSKAAQDLMDGLVTAADALPSSVFGDSNWRIRYLEADDLLQAECIYESGRDDL